jgi:hypothetical protein
MPHLLLTSVLLFALLAVVAIAIGASLRIARDLMLEEPSETATDTAFVPSAYAVRQADAGYQAQGHGPGEDFGLGLQHANPFPQSLGQSFGRNRSFGPRV